MTNPTMEAWAAELSRMTCIRVGVVREWMESRGITDLEGLQRELGLIYPGPAVARAVTRSIMGW